MNDSRFDRLVCSLAATRSRRSLTRLLGGLTLSGPVALLGQAGTEAKRKKKKKKKKRGTTPTTSAPPPGPGPVAPPPPPRVVISQIYAHGGYPGALYTHDYIELFNRDTTPVVIDNWSVQFSTPAGETWATTTLTGRTMPPGSYLLIKQGQNGSNGTALPQPDFEGTINLLTGGGEVALVTSTTPLSCGTGLACVTAPGVIDFLGYGNLGSPGEGGAPAPAPSHTKALVRDDGGCTDTNNNATDFSLADPLPRNSAWRHTCP